MSYFAFTVGVTPCGVRNPTQLEDIGLTMADVEDFGRTGL